MAGGVLFDPHSARQIVQLVRESRRRAQPLRPGQPQGSDATWAPLPLLQWYYTKTATAAGTTLTFPTGLGSPYGFNAGDMLLLFVAGMGAAATAVTATLDGASLPNAYTYETGGTSPQLNLAHFAKVLAEPTSIANSSIVITWPSAQTSRLAALYRLWRADGLCNPQDRGALGACTEGTSGSTILPAGGGDFDPAGPSFGTFNVTAQGENYAYARVLIFGHVAVNAPAEDDVGVWHNGWSPAADYRNGAGTGGAGLSQYVGLAIPPVIPDTHYLALTGFTPRFWTAASCWYAWGQRINGGRV